MFSTLVEKKSIEKAVLQIKNALADNHTNPNDLSTFIYENYSLNKRDLFIQNLISGHYEKH